MRRARLALRDDSGIAMMLVIGVMTVLFLTATLLMVMVNYSTLSEKWQETRVKEIHLADAGINAYLYELRSDPLYYQTHPTLGPTSQDDGVWLVMASAPTSRTPLTLRAQGRLNSETASRTVVATVRFPTFADYMFLSNADLNVGGGATIIGRVRTNGDLNNAGTITGASYAHGTITGAGTFGPSGNPIKKAGEPVLDFGGVLADMDSIRTAAQANSPQTYFAPSGYANGGYQIAFTGNGKQFTIRSVSAVSSNGSFTYGTVNLTRDIPPTGVIFVQDNVWVSGQYAAPCTIASSKNIYIPSSITRLDASATYALGLISAQSIVVPTQYDTISSASTTTITAALLAQSGSIYGNLVSGYRPQALHIYGSMAYNTYGYFASGNPATVGFQTRRYQYDAGLENFPPPMFPQQKSGSLRLNTWVEG
ncbi:MAG TPA: hypothetical protein VF902_06950 [Coriobacteriia bacterium]